MTAADGPPGGAARPEPWTLERVEREAPHAAGVARLHRAIEDAMLAAERRAGGLHPPLAGAPGVHWMQGVPLLEAADAASVCAALPPLVAAAATAAASVAPSIARAAGAVAADAVRRPAAHWRSVVFSPRSGEFPDGPEPALARFLALRALSVPARHLARSLAAPHPDRWKRACCPFCGLALAASVARAGSGRTNLCVLCGGRWETTESLCAGCGERNLEKFKVFALREAGPATLEACTTCGSALKVFGPSDLVWGPPLAVECLTVRLDVLAERDEGIRRDAAALAAIYPP